MKTWSNEFYVTITKDGEYDIIGSKDKCDAEIKISMTNNMLKLNDDKTELFVSSPQRVKYKYLQFISSRKIKNQSLYAIRDNVNAEPCKLYDKMY